MAKFATVGFVGLGVMGEPMCRNLVQKSGFSVVAYDLNPEPLERLETYGVVPAKDLAETVSNADTIMISLPSGFEVDALCTMEDGLLSLARAGQTIVDLGTTPVALTRQLATGFAAKDVAFADAPVSRTRAAAEAGTLSILVGGDKAVFESISSILDCFAEEVTLCGGIGAGQMVKQLNNMVLTETVVALAEALSVGRRAGLDDKLLFETLSKCSADSFALRNHGMKALLPDEFPKRAFPTAYMLKDIDYALALSQDNGLELPGASLAKRLLEKSSESGYADNYFPALIKVLDPGD